MHFHYKVATTLSLLLVVSFVFQLLAVLSVPLTSHITLCTYDGYKFGVFGLCSTSSGTCSPVEIGYSRNTINELQGFSLPSNTRHSISTLLIVHPISLGFTFILLVMSILTHFKIFNRSLKFLFFLILWCFVTFLLCLLSFLVDILLFIPHLDWGGWIILASTVLIAVSGTVACIMRRTASSRNLYDFNKQNLDKSVEMYSMLPLKESYGYVRDNDDYDDDEEDDDQSGSVSDVETKELDLTNQRLLYDDQNSAQQTDIVRNESLSYRGYQNRPYPHNNNAVDSPLDSPGIADNEDGEGYYTYNPMNDTNERFTRSARNSLTLLSPRLQKRNSMLSAHQIPPGRPILPYPAEDIVDEESHDEEWNGVYPQEDGLESEEGDSELLDALNEEQPRMPTIPRVGTPTMDEQPYVPQQVMIRPLMGPRDLPSSSMDDVSVLPVPQPSPVTTDETNSTHPFESNVINDTNTQVSLATTLDASTAAHKNYENTLSLNHNRFMSTTSAGPRSSSSFYNGSDYNQRLIVDESEASSVAGSQIPSSDYLDSREHEELSTVARMKDKQLLKKASLDSIASSHYTSISQRPINPRYFESDSTTPQQQKRMSAQKNSVHPFRSVLMLSKPVMTQEQKLKLMREKLANNDVI